MLELLRHQDNGRARCGAVALAVLLAVLTSAASAAEYVVKRNDTLSRIAREHGVSTGALARANDISVDEIIRPGQKLDIPGSSALIPEREPERSVIVRKNDSLSLIARTHGVNVHDLANANGLSLKDTIHPGQRLVIPSGPVAAPAPALSSSVQRAIDRASVKPGRWKYVVVHHSATPVGSAKGMDAYHRDKRHMENGLAYHFVIGNGKGMKDGEIFVGNRWTKQLQGGHLSSESLNQVAIGVCLVGDFNKSVPTRDQLDSLDALLEALMKRCHLKTSAVRSHKQIQPRHTECPGKRFDLNAVKKRLN